MIKKFTLLTLALSFSSLSVAADEGMTVSIKRMKMETALRIAQAAIKACRKEGIQIGVTVVDRSGQVQVVLRDVLAMDITLPISKQKAHT
ncbi:MAG: heme-binding protein, partial [Gammaproteobacteria bacterium]|nr:heme-binding protein [Gammaproteobacteria bacterium]